MIDPLGGVQQIVLPYKPLYGSGLGEGAIIRVTQSLYAEIVGARLDVTPKRSRVLLSVRPLQTHEVLAGWGEYAEPVIDLETMEPVEVP